ncbi:heterokaryon incompatibility protein-domain-containing protein [Hypoxylon sp. FL1284]|nr:heterokaryon incompatibility protein-domain-containing protein [Hypoxylon sp. FL1284]
MEMSISLYQPLDTSRREIRLVRILPSNDTIRCTLQVESLSSDLKYAALSYAWGDPKVTRDIIVNDEKFPATENLYEALLQFLSNTALLSNDGDTALPLWIDAICINQKDVNEKNHQVQLMGSIYSSATRVLSWLGVPGVERGDITIRTMRDMVEAAFSGETDQVDEAGLRDFLTSQPQSLRPPDESEEDLPDEGAMWRDIRFLFERPYWTRVWIVQEMVLAENADTHLFVCGSETIPFDAMEKTAKAFDFLVRHEDPQRVGLKQRDWHLTRHFGSPFIGIQIVSYIRQSRASGDLFSTGEIPFHIMRLQATDKKDLVYGFHAITSSDLTVDYHKTTKQVYIDWYEMTLRQLSSVSTKDGRPATHPILFAGLGLDNASKSGLPSWLPNLGRLSDIFRDTYIRRLWDYNARMGRVDGSNSSAGSTSSSVRQRQSLDTPTIISGNTMQISGVRCCGIITEVIEVEKSSDTSRWPRSLHKLCVDTLNRKLKDHPLGISTLQALFYLMHGGQDPMTGKHLNVPPDPDLGFHVFRCFGCVDRVLDVLVSIENVVDLDAIGQLRAKSRSDKSLQFALDANMCKGVEKPDNLDIVLLTIKHFGGLQAALALHKSLDPSQEKAIFQTDDGYMGIGPKGLRKGDQPCFLKDLASPVLIRDNGDGKCSNVGLAYIYGLLESKATGKIKEDVVEAERFEIV